jgi:transposase-like protein
VEKVPVSDLCQELKLQPTVFYRWLKEFFENGAAAFQKQSDGESKRDKERIAAIQEEITELYYALNHGPTPYPLLKQ